MEIILLLKLFYTFVKVALFNFGGGFVMITLIRTEILNQGWLDELEFNQIIAVSQITPGAIAINTATYVGFEIAGLVGALFSTLAIPIPSFLIVIFISPILIKYKEHPLNKMIFYGIRAVIVGLILNAAIVVAKTPFLQASGYSLSNLFHGAHLPEFISILNLGSLVIFGCSMFLLLKYKLNPILVLIVSGVLGIIIFAF